MKTMIEHYEIRDVNKEKVLILYLSYDYEFSSDFEHNNVLMKINEFIKRNKIKWNGKKVILVVGGLVLGTLVLGKINPQTNPHSTSYNYVSNVILNHFDEFNNEIGYSKIEIKDPVIIVEEGKEQEKVEIKDEPIKIQKPSSNTKPQEEKTVQEQTKQTIVTIYRSNGNVEQLELESYIVGVVAAEMPAAFNIEALKAQSIAARTYALKAIKEEKILTDNEKTQSYKDINELKELWKDDFSTYYNKIKSCVKSTEGQVLTYNGEYIEALYHSTSNGYTENAYEVFGNSYPYLITVPSIWDINATSYSRDKTFSFEEFSNILGININKESLIEVLEKTNSGRIISIKIDDNYYNGIELRNLLGLRSTDFDININTDTNQVIITTRGYGHGVGMSQYGANGMANNGKNYKEILSHYYPGTTLKTVNH